MAGDHPEVIGCETHLSSLYSGAVKPCAREGVAETDVAEADVGRIEEVVLCDADVATGLAGELRPKVLVADFYVIGLIAVAIFYDTVVDKVTPLTIVAYREDGSTGLLEGIIGS